MSRTYRAILHGDRVQWLNGAPAIPAAVPVEITVPDDAGIDPVARRRVILGSFERLAAGSASSNVGEPVAWQRESRAERTLPERE